MKYEQIVETCCRDLRRYLETALKTARGGVITFTASRLMQVVSPLGRRRRAWCLSRALRRWRWNTGVYVVPRHDAETLLTNFDELCASIRNQRPAEEKREERTAEPPRDSGGETVLISFHVPPALMQILDEYAQRINQTRSDVVRVAIRRLIEKYRNVEVDLQHPAVLELPDAAGDESVFVTFHETPYVIELLDMYAAALQVSRSDVIRAAIRQMLDKIHTAEETQKELEYIVAV
jgi:metal-responsive CopG/Arc/MetJ family transcriptional regulator